MRVVLLLPAVTLCSGATAELHVVVHTNDALLHETAYTCPQREGLPVPMALLPKFLPGRASWHAVGGVPPYRLVSIERTPGIGGAALAGAQHHPDGITLTGPPCGAGEMVCFTVMDALGNVASGCGLIGLRHTQNVIRVDCDELPPGIIASRKAMDAPKAATAPAAAPSGAPRTPRIGHRGMSSRDPGTDPRPHLHRVDRITGRDRVTGVAPAPTVGSSWSTGSSSRQRH